MGKMEREGSEEQGGQGTKHGNGRVLVTVMWRLRQCGRNLCTPYSRVSFRMTLNDLE